MFEGHSWLIPLIALLFLFICWKLAKFAIKILLAIIAIILGIAVLYHFNLFDALAKFLSNSLKDIVGQSSNLFRSHLSNSSSELFW